MTLFGWDASDFDWSRGPMDLAAAKRDGISVFTHKATEGTSTKHKHFGEAVSRARAAGVPYIGAYLVARSGNAAAEVSYFLDYVNAQAPWWTSYPGWFWQIDLEKWPYDAVSAGTGEAVADALAARTGRPTLIYASRGQYGNSLAGTDHPLWNAAYGHNPVAHYREAYPGDGGSGWTAYSGRTPILWQYGSKTTIGRQPECDANAIRDEAGWRALFGPTEEDTLSNLSDSDTLKLMQAVDRINGSLPGGDTYPVRTTLTVGHAMEANKLAEIGAKVAAPTPVTVDAAGVAAALAGNADFVKAVGDACAASLAARVAS